MSKTLLSSIAVAMLAFAAPAFAGGPETATVNVASADGAVVTNATETARTASSPERRYCVVDRITGSRMQHRVCKTRKEWLDEGFDPLAK